MQSSPELEGLLIRLCVLLEAQTEAITALAASNERMADEMMAANPEPDDEESSGTYMDGSPIN